MISVLVTSFNQVEKLKVTIESLINQKTKYSYEIIISDDHSTDESFKYLESLSKEFESIRVTKPRIKKCVGNNRNNLIKNASKKYSVFVDGDDPQESNFIDKICMSIEDDDIYNLVGFKEVWNDSVQVKKTKKYFNVFLNVYKTEFLKTLNFVPDISIGEDVLFTMSNYEALRGKMIKKVDMYYSLNRCDDNISLTKNGNYTDRFNLELELFQKMNMIDRKLFPAYILEEKKIDLINFSILAECKFDESIHSLKGLNMKHKISYIMYKSFPKKLYKKIIISKLGNKV